MLETKLLHHTLMPAQSFPYIIVQHHGQISSCQQPTISIPRSSYRDLSHASLRVAHRQLSGLGTRHCLLGWLNYFIQYLGEIGQDSTDLRKTRFPSTHWGIVHHGLNQFVFASDLFRFICESHVPGSLRDCRVRSSSIVYNTQNGGRCWRMNSCFGNALDKCRSWYMGPAMLRDGYLSG
jgi:hypothetical protein